MPPVQGEIQAGEDAGRRIAGTVDGQGKLAAGFGEAVEGYAANAEARLRRDRKRSHAHHIARACQTAVNPAAGAAERCPQSAAQGARALIFDPAGIRARHSVRTGLKRRNSIASANRDQSRVDAGAGAGASGRPRVITNAHISGCPIVDAVRGTYDRSRTAL